MPLLFAFIVVVALALSASAKDNPQPTEGRICAFADFDRDKYTDLLVVKDGKGLFVRLQNEDGEFKDGTTPFFIDSSKLPQYFNEKLIVSCAVGDFDGNSHADVLVTTRKSESAKKVVSAVCFFLGPTIGFNCTLVGDEAEFSDQPIIFDVDADGISDVLAFDSDNNGSPLKCYQGVQDSHKFKDCSSVFKNFNSTLHPNFAHAFVDVNGDLSAELVFGITSKDTDLAFETWVRRNGNEEWIPKDIIGAILPPKDNVEVKYGQPTFGDVNADGFMDILIPRCDKSKSQDDCALLDLLIWEKERGWTKIDNFIGSYRIVGDSDDIVQLRIGDFDLDGFPDLVSVISTNENKRELFIIKNVACEDLIDCQNISRTFKLDEKSRLIESSDISAGIKRMATFFDVREDGSLDVLVEYEKQEYKTVNFNFIPCDDKGDTTFLKVEVFTKICYLYCKDAEVSGKQNSYGSSISWHGTTLKYTMSDTSGYQRHGVQTQIAQTSHRALQLPFATFGLGRSPNFVDTLTVGTPAFFDPAQPHTGSNLQQNNQWKQLVPNARLYIIPPGPDGSHGNHSWVSRLYMTPSRLIIQSLIVLVAVCGLIIVIIAFLHWRERKQDLVERQAQAHRFHFDAM